MGKRCCCCGYRGRTLEIGKIRLLVELGALETERVDNVVDLDGSILEALILLLGGRVASNVNVAIRDHNLGGINLVDNVIDEFPISHGKRPKKEKFVTLENGVFLIRAQRESEGNLHLVPVRAHLISGNDISVELEGWREERNNAYQQL